jgi:phosphatidylinositol alpha-1,6-mannosyltransferase
MIVMTTQCFPPDFGGIENLMGGVATRLNQAGEPTLVLADAIRSDRAEAAFSFPVKRFGGLKPIRRWLKGRAIRSLISEQATGHNPASLLIADSWKSLEHVGSIDLPILAFAHGNELQEKPDSAKGRRIRKALSRADLILANSKFTAGLLDRLGVEPSDIAVFHPPIDPQPEARPNELEALDQRLGGRGPLLVTVARLEPRKGIDDVIAAHATLITAHPNLVYALAGDGEDRARLEALVANRNLQGHVMFLGRINDQERAALLTRATLFVMPTRKVGRSVEGFGISYIEAGWYGVPSIASQIGGGVEAVLDGETGLHVGGNSQHDLPHAISRLLSDAEMRLKMGKAAAQRAQTELCWDTAIATLQNHIAVTKLRHGNRHGSKP